LFDTQKFQSNKKNIVSRDYFGSVIGNGMGSNGYGGSLDRFGYNYGYYNDDNYYMNKYGDDDDDDEYYDEDYVNNKQARKGKRRVYSGRTERRAPTMVRL
jgi:hypothetical protein